MFLSDKEEYEYIIYAQRRIGQEMKNDLIKSNGFDLDKLFIVNDESLKKDETISYVSTKKWDNTKESKNDIKDFIDDIGNHFEELGNTKEPDELSEKKLKKFSDIYESFDFDKSHLEFLNLYQFEHYFSRFEHEFHDKAILEVNEDDKDSEFVKPEDLDSFLGIFKILSVEKDYNFDLHFKYLDSEDDTGYIIPSYNQLSETVSYSDLTKKYNSVVAEFKLEHSEKVSVTDLVYITQFRDLLYSQVERQIKVIDSLNGFIKNYLKSVYRFLELHLLINHKKRYPDFYKTEVPDNWYYFIGMVRSINSLFSSNVLDDSKLESYLKKINRIPVLHTDFKEGLCNDLESLYRKKEPILIIANKLLIKIRCVESIIEDMLMEQTLKPPKDFVDWFKSHGKVAEQEKITNKDIICTALEYKRQGYVVSHMFEKMREWLLDEDKKYGEKEFKKEYGFGISNMDSFNKHVNNHKNICPPENN